jgi:hypothetical protein
MRSAVTSSPRHRAALLLSTWLPWFVLAAALLLLLPAGARAGGVEIGTFVAQRQDDGLVLDYSLDFELPRGAEEALAKAVPLYFVAEAEVFRSRWYWTDKRVASAVRVWRIVFQPLTFTYRVTFGGLSQSYATRSEAFAAMRRGVNWKIADAGQLDNGSDHYVEFSFRLDTSLLPRPMQIGIGNAPDWALSVERMQRVD